MTRTVNTYFGEHRYRMALWILVTAAVGFLAPLKAFNLQWIIDSSSREQAIGKVGLGALVIVGSFLFEFLSRRIYTRMACGAEAAIRNDVVRNVLSRDGFSCEKDEQGDQGNRRNSGDHGDAAYISLLTNDMRTLYDDYFTSIFHLIFWGAILLVALGMYLFISPVLLIVVVVISVPPLIVPRVLNTRIRVARDAWSLEMAGYVSCLKEYLSGFETIWNFLRQEPYIRFHEKRSAENQREKEHFQQNMNTAVTVTSLMSNLTFIVVLLAGMFLVFDGRITIGYMVTACSLANFVISPCQIISQSCVKIKSTKGIRERLEQEMNRRLGKQKNGKIISDIQNISCRNVGFSYSENGRQILKSVDFAVQGREKTGIIGESGSGKSTFAKILHQYYPDYQGEILVNGMELRDLDQTCFFSKAGYISQHTFLFRDTIRNNICMYESFSDQQVREALELAGLETFVEGLPNGMDTMLEENGKNLSGGQRQRLAIARLIIRNYPVIIADEITAGLDRETAEQVMKNLLSLDCMVLAITHDTDCDFMKRFDKLYKVVDGKLVKAG